MCIRDRGNNHRECAVLYRSNAQSRVLEEAMLRAQMPYRIYGGQRFFERAEIRSAIAYMRLISRRDADSAFERVVNTPSRGIGDRTLEQIRSVARKQNVSLCGVLRNGWRPIPRYQVVRGMRLSGLLS